MNKKHIKVLHVSYSDSTGGAARAAFRVHQAIVNNNQNNNLISSMRVIKKNTNLRNIHGGYPESQKFKYQTHCFR